MMNTEMELACARLSRLGLSAAEVDVALLLASLHAHADDAELVQLTKARVLRVRNFMASRGLNARRRQVSIARVMRRSRKSMAGA
jgi:hypothetical protein